MSAASTLTRMTTLAFLGLSTAACGLSVREIAEPENAPGESLPKYSANDPMPECGKGWRQTIPLIGTLECSKPFVIEIDPRLKAQVPQPRNPAMY